jgi:hypothetical protein
MFITRAILIAVPVAWPLTYRFSSAFVAGTQQNLASLLTNLLPQLVQERIEPISPEQYFFDRGLVDAAAVEAVNQSLAQS